MPSLPPASTPLPSAAPAKAGLLDRLLQKEKLPADAAVPTQPVPAPLPADDSGLSSTTAGALQRRDASLATSGLPRDVRPLTEQEIYRAIDKFKTLSPGTPLQKLVIVRYGNRIRCLEPVGSELRYGRERDFSELQQWLAETAPLLPGLLNVFTLDGERKKTPQILDEYGSLLPGSVVQDLTIAESHLDTTTGDFRVAAAPLTQLDPVFDPQIDQWLGLLGGAQAPALKAWVASVTVLHRPSAAPFLIGDSGAGKSLFIEGLARLWQAGAATPLDALVDGAFNGSIARCPLVAADEEFPPGFRSTKLRRWTGSSVQDLHEKYEKRTSLKGALRFVFAANKANALRFTDQLGRDDLEAVGLRFIFIDVDDRPKQFLRELGGRNATAGWVDGFAIARHALWLRDNLMFTPGQRLIVEGTAITKAHRALILNGVVAEQVATAIAKFLDAPDKFVTLLSNGTFIVGEGELLANGQGLLDAWRVLFTGGERVPPLLDAINAALSNFSLKKEHARRETPSGQTRRYWMINPEVIIDFAERNQIGDPDVLRQRVNGARLRAASKARPFAALTSTSAASAPPSSTPTEGPSRN
jgi:hypothetical protein